MKGMFQKAVPLLFFLILTLLLVSCSNAQQLFDKGQYKRAIAKVNAQENPSSEDLLIKARSYIELGEHDHALESLFLFLAMDESRNASERAFAVKHFIELNKSDKLTVLVLTKTDGIEAQKSLYKAYSRMGDFENAKEILSSLSATLDFVSFISLIFEAPVDSSYILDLLYGWYGSLQDTDRGIFLQDLELLTKLDMGESVAKRALALTDVLMENDYYITDDLRLSLLFKIKGNILEKLFDKVNARIYWSQAYKLNPEDNELRNRLQ